MIEYSAELADDVLKKLIMRQANLTANELEIALTTPAVSEAFLELLTSVCACLCVRACLCLCLRLRLRLCLCLCLCLCLYSGC